jgi:hypothetical protein
MKSLTSSLPWQFWFIWGWLMIVILLKYAIWPRKNTPPASLALKISWVLCLFVAFLVIATSYIDGTGRYTEFSSFVGQATISTILLLAVTVIIGGYQTIMRPEFDPRKRRIMLIQGLIGIACLILLGWLLGPFIWERYFK